MISCSPWSDLRNDTSCLIPSFTGAKKNGFQKVYPYKVNDDLSYIDGQFCPCAQETTCGTIAYNFSFSVLFLISFAPYWLFLLDLILEHEWPEQWLIYWNAIGRSECNDRKVIGIQEHSIIFFSSPKKQRSRANPKLEYRAPRIRWHHLLSIGAYSRSRDQFGRDLISFRQFFLSFCPHFSLELWISKNREQAFSAATQRSECNRHRWRSP